MLSNGVGYKISFNNLRDYEILKHSLLNGFIDIGINNPSVSFDQKALSISLNYTQPELEAFFSSNSRVSECIDFSKPIPELLDSYDGKKSVFRIRRKKDAVDEFVELREKASEWLQQDSLFACAPEYDIDDGTTPSILLSAARNFGALAIRRTS